MKFYVKIILKIGWDQPLGSKKYKWMLAVQCNRGPGKLLGNTFSNNNCNQSNPFFLNH